MCSDSDDAVNDIELDVASEIAAAGEGEWTAQNGVGGLKIAGVEVEAIAGGPVEFWSGTIGLAGGAADLDELAGFGFGKLIEPQDQPPVLGA
jgi:hypothetical protein